VRQNILGFIISASKKHRRNLARDVVCEEEATKEAEGRAATAAKEERVNPSSPRQSQPKGRPSRRRDHFSARRGRRNGGRSGRSTPSAFQGASTPRRRRRPTGASTTGRIRPHAAGPTETATSAKTPRTVTNESSFWRGDMRVANCATASAIRLRGSPSLRDATRLRARPRDPTRRPAAATAATAPSWWSSS